MKPEVLEALLIDRAAGELAPEVVSLLDAYLAQNPAAAKQAALVTTTFDLTRAAVATPFENPRALDVGRLEQEQRTSRSRAFRREALRLAACVMLGLGIGWLLRSAPRSPALTTARPAFAALSSGATPDTGSHFWSAAHFAPDLAKIKTEKKP